MRKINKEDVHRSRYMKKPIFHRRKTEIYRNTIIIIVIIIIIIRRNKKYIMTNERPKKDMGFFEGFLSYTAARTASAGCLPLTVHIYSFVMVDESPI